MQCGRERASISAYAGFQVSQYLDNLSVDLSRLLRLSVQRHGKQSEDKSTNKPDGPEPHNGLLYYYESTNITGEKVVNDYRTQLNDALMESYAGRNSRAI